MTNQPETGTAIVGWTTLFASTGTLICCAMPIVLVSMGFGAAVASLTTQFPLLVTLSEYKVSLFFASGVLLGVTGWFIWGRRYQCPVESALAKRCAITRLWNKRIFWCAAAIWGVGFSAAFLLLPLRYLLRV